MIELLNCVHMSGKCRCLVEDVENLLPGIYVYRNSEWKWVLSSYNNSIITNIYEAKRVLIIFL